MCVYSFTGGGMILLKHLSRQFDIDPYQLRKLLRAQGYEPLNRRWRWEDGDNTLEDIRLYLKSISSGSTTNSSARSILPDGGPGTR